MRLNKKLIVVAGFIVVMLVSQGCMRRWRQTNTFQQQPTQRYQANISPKRFNDIAQKNPSAIEIALEWSKKCEKLTSQVIALREQNQRIIAENRQLKNALTPAQLKIKELQTNIEDADKMLVDMRIELNNWKTDIIGYRDEIRSYHYEELQTLLKILETLGGETLKTVGNAQIQKSETASAN